MKPAANVLLPIDLSKPLPLWAAIEHLMASDQVPDSSKPGLKSTAIDAVRYALHDGEAPASRDVALREDILPLLIRLPRAAYQAAKDNRHRTPADHARRAARFCALIRGDRTHQTVTRAIGCPPLWRPLAAIVKGRHADLAFLAQCCAALGERDAPAVMPDPEEILQVGEEMVGDTGRGRAKAALVTYRCARRKALTQASDAERQSLRRRFAPVRKILPPGTCHLGVERATFDMIEELRDVQERDGRLSEEARAKLPDPAEMNSEALLRELYPELAADYDQWDKDAGANLSPAYRHGILRAIERLAGMATRAGRGTELRGLDGIHKIFLPTVTVQSDLTGNPRLAKAAGVDPALAQTQVSLLAYLVEQEAPHSLARSPLLDQDVIGDLDSETAKFITDSLAKDCKLLWYVVQEVYSGLANMGGHEATEWALIQSQWNWLKDELAKRRVPPELRVNAKNKLLLIQTVTAPQLECVGIPLRKREIRGLRREWQAARAKAVEAGHTELDEHPAVREARAEYLASAVSFSALCLAFDDGMRRKQYEHGRAGRERNFVFDIQDNGGAGEAPTIRKLETHWSGDRRDPACLKVRAVNGRTAMREREVNLSVVDPVILLDVLVPRRAHQLVIAGVIEDETKFDLQADLEAGLYALFIGGRSGTGELSMSNLGGVVGRELYYIVKMWLRPDLPEWDELGPGWRCLWSMHILRLLLASYWGGVRDEWALAEYLTMDVETTLRANYVEIDRGLAERKKLKLDHWEHPNAYDSWMDRLRGREVFDPLLDPDLPLPDHLVEVVARIRAEEAGSGAKGQEASGSSARIRKARPGQKKPQGGGRSTTQ